MSRKAIIFFGTVILALSVFGARAQRNPKIDFYENFFQKNQIQNSDSAFAKAEKKLEDAEGSHDIEKKAEAFKELGLLHLTVSQDFDKAMDAFIQALMIEEALKLNPDQLVTYIAISDVFQETGNFQKGNLSAVMSV